MGMGMTLLQVLVLCIQLLQPQSVGATNPTNANPTCFTPTYRDPISLGPEDEPYRRRPFIDGMKVNGGGGYWYRGGVTLLLSGTLYTLIAHTNHSIL
jgi:hypothetical protein